MAGHLGGQGYESTIMLIVWCHFQKDLELTSCFIRDHFFPYFLPSLAYWGGAGVRGFGSRRFPVIMGEPSYLLKRTLPSFISCTFQPYTSKVTPCLLLVARPWQPYSEGTKSTRNFLTIKVHQKEILNWKCLLAKDKMNQNWKMKVFLLWCWTLALFNPVNWRSQYLKLSLYIFKKMKL